MFIAAYVNVTKFKLNDKISCQETGNDENIAVFASMFYGSIYVVILIGVISFIKVLYI